MIKFEFANLSILLALLSVVLVFVLYYASAKLRKSASRRRMHYAFKVLSLVSLALAVGHPYLEQTSSELTIPVMLDISGSMEEGVANPLIAQVQGFAKHNLNIEVIPFASKAAPSFDLSDANLDFSSLRNSWGKLNLGQTNLEQAYLVAKSIAAKQVVLISDGYENSGDLLRTLESSTDLSSSPRIFPIVPEQEGSQPAKFQIAKLYAPLVAPRDRSVDVLTTIKNTSKQAMRAKLEIKHDSKVILSRDIELASESQEVVTALSDPSQEGIKEITATLTPMDKTLPASIARTFISGSSREKILLLSGSEKETQLLNEVLGSKAYKIKSISSPTLSTTIPQFQDFSVVILNNVPAKSLSSSNLKLLKNYVNDGGSLIVIGGNQSFGLGGYIGSDIEPILPVLLVPPQTTVKRLNVAVSLVLDKSRSMDSNNKINYAKDAARAVIGNLKDDDYIQVVGFDAAPFVVVKMAQLRGNRQLALDRVGRLFPAGRTNLLPAIDEARRALKQTEAGRKHVVILTDGRIPQAGAYYIDLVSDMRRAGITVSTIMLGSDVDVGELRSIAQMGGGAFYQTTDPSSLANVFIRDIKVATGERTLKEEQEYLVRPGPGKITSTSISAFPPLLGFVQTKKREQANLELVVFAKEEAYPLLASWPVGAGKVLAFTSDASGRWSSMWSRWPKFGVFWEDLIDSVRDKKSEISKEEVIFELRYGYERGKLVIDQTIFEDLPKPTSEIILPDGTRQSVAWSLEAPGHFRAVIDQPIPGKYELNQKFENRPSSPVAFYLDSELFGEQKGQGFNLPYLSRVASLSRGKLNPFESDFDHWKTESKTHFDLSWYFVALALLGLMAEILRRES